MKKLCIYHGGCIDGFGAAWVVRRMFGDQVEFHAGYYGSPPPDCTGREVILVDFSYKLLVMQEILAGAKHVLVIDHHKTAKEELQSLVGTLNFDLYFDLKRSGAMLAWDYFFPDDYTPALIVHIQDRDLWTFAFPETREIIAALFSYPYEFEVWDGLMNTLTKDLRKEGKAIERKHFKDLEELLIANSRHMVIGGHRVPVANIPHFFASDAGHRLGEGVPFAATYMDTKDGRAFSLRSSQDGGIDVSEIAKRYGGGGHRNAAGFKMQIGWEGE